jgi:pimeloyl-ACP methyl ester carboxylesterase
MAGITQNETEQVEAANTSGLQPIVFVHGLWLLANSWDRWRDAFADAGYSTLAPGWPDDPDTVEQARAHPGVFARKTVGQVADHFQDVISQLALRSASPVLRNPANRGKAVALTYEQFRYGFANEVDADEAKLLHQKYAVAGAGRMLFQAATANFNPWTDAKVDSKNPKRGPLLIVSGEKDHTVPWAIANASYKKQKRNEGVTEIVEIPGRGHSLVIDRGWREVADTALDFVRRFTN